ncbi:MAG: hypothetical protein EBZ74_00660 [Planctomycetia bacterium]|nr:hypothetical protein [Planctomycetia bacterium]
MFIEQSVGRRRVVRLLFVLVGVVPCVLLATAAWWRRSAGHVAALERAAAAHLGVPVSIDGVAHPRPGVLRLSRVVVGRAAADAFLEVADVEIEESPEEIRVSVPRVEVAPGAVRLLRDLAAEWIARPARFRQSWVIDVGEVGWALGAAAGIEPAGGWHAECVAAQGSRAVRVRREPACGEEIRVLSRDGRLEAEGRVADGLPAAIAASLLDGAAGAWGEAIGPRAVVRGEIAAVRSPDGWAGTFTGTVDGVIPGGAEAWWRRRIDADARLAFAPLRFAANRLDRCDVELSARGGTVAQELLDALVGSLGCRPGPAYRALDGDAVRRFDTLGCRLLLDEAGLRIEPLAAGRGLVSYQGMSLVEGPTSTLPPARLAWFLAPAGRPAVPASPESAWLISVLPGGGARAGF